MSVLVSNIQRFSLHDGPGIRTTVFLVGCGLKCPWCANPENRENIAGIHDITLNEMRYREYSCDEIVEVILRDKEFYANDGGVTFSGGEPLIWSDDIAEICRKLEDYHIASCVETALEIKNDNVKSLNGIIDKWIIDLKTTDEKKYSDVIGGNWDLYNKNLDYILSNDGIYILRIPLLHDFNTSEEDIEGFFDFCVDKGIKNMQFLVGHNLAKKKYDILGKEFVDYSLSAEERKKVAYYISQYAEDFDVKTNVIN